MAAVWSAPGPLNAAPFDATFTPQTWTISGATLGVGDIWLFFYGDTNGIGNFTPSSMVIDGVSAVQQDTTQFNTAGSTLSIWKAAGVTHATGNIQIVLPPVSTVSASWGLATGNGAPVITYDQNIGVNTQGPVVGTILTGGVGVAVIGSSFSPVTGSTPWSGSTDDPNMNAHATTANQCGCAGSTVPSAGAASVSIPTSGWNNTANIMALLAFPAGGSPPAAPPIGIIGLTSSEW